MKVYDKVKYFLEAFPQTRDSDKLLIYLYWNNQQLRVFGKQGDLTKEFLLGSATSSETIRRCRQKIQEENPELRSSRQIQKIKDRKQGTKGAFIYDETT